MSKALIVDHNGKSRHISGETIVQRSHVMEQDITCRKKHIRVIWVAVSVGSVLAARCAHATQTHAAPEGLYVHQMTHVVFFAAMVYFVLRLCLSGHVRDRAWFNIAVSATFLALWNIDTFVVHWAQEHLRPELFGGSAEAWSQTLTMSEPVAWIVYVGKFDHLLCVPAIIFFLRGLRSFNRQALQKEATP